MASASAHLRITRLTLGNWRNFRSADVELASRVFLVGPNASGKSNLLDAVRFLHDLVSVGGGLAGAIEQRAPVSVLRCYAARQSPDIEIEAELGSEDRSDEWRYELAFNQKARQPQPLISRERVLRRGKLVFERPDKEDEKDPARLSQTALEQVNLNQSFRDVADFLREVRYLHVVPQLVRDPERSVGKRNDPFGGDFLDQIARTPERTRNKRFRQVLQALKVAVPQLEALELEQDHGVAHLRGRYRHWRRHGNWQTESDFSDGTLRLFGLLWSALDGTGPLLLEEPELSLHPGVVRYVPQMLVRTQRQTGRQVLLSTHSPNILEDEGIGLDEVLMLSPSREGTQVRAAGEVAEVRALLNGGLSMADAVVPQTQPTDADQLALFPAK